MSVFLNNPLPFVVGAIILVLLAMIIRLEFRINRLLRGKKAADLEDSITGLGKDTDRIREKVIEIIGAVQDLDNRLKKSIRRVETVRFNPFRGEGGNQSFATALLDDTGDGVVISSLYSRDKVGIYAKPVKRLTSEFELTKEEREAITKAAKNKLEDYAD